jgi:hypothetical protein
MTSRRHVAAGVLILTACAAVPVSGQGRQDPEALMATQREAMMPLSFMDGIWRGSASTVSPSGERHTLTQTERVGPFLGGTVKVVEGRGFETDGRVSFNALGIISYDPTTQTYSMRSYAQGHAGDFVITPMANGFVWEISAGSMTIRYTAVIDGGTWHEVGDRIVPDQEPIRFFEMTLTRLGDTDWPGAGAVRPR